MEIWDSDVFIAKTSMDRLVKAGYFFEKPVEPRVIGIAAQSLMAGETVIVDLLHGSVYRPSHGGVPYGYARFSMKRSCEEGATLMIDPITGNLVAKE